jgi:hypothetical protein
MRTIGVISLSVALACAAVSTSAAPAGAVDPKIDQNTACAGRLDAIRVASDPNAVVLRAGSLPGPFRGTITAFGRATTWTGTFDRWNATTVDGREWPSVIVKADAPIEGIEYAPTFASCTFHAGTRNSSAYDHAWLVDGPIVTVTNPQPVDPPACASPYVPASTLRAFEPNVPREAMETNITGYVRIAVALDEKGRPQHARIASSPSVLLNAASLDAAMHSTYSPTIFRCKPVASGYEFNVEYSAR